VAFTVTESEENWLVWWRNSV